MKTILKISLLLFIMGSSYEMNAMLTTKALHPQSVTQKKKLKFKERAALWVLKRKLKKQRKKYQAKLQMLNDSTVCSKIYLKTGDTIEARILELSDGSIRFARCTDSAEMTISKLDVQKIAFGDGTILYQDHIEKRKGVAKKRNRKGGVFTSIFSMLLGLLSFTLLFDAAPAAVIVAILGLGLGIYSIVQMSGKGVTAMGIIGVVISGVIGTIGLLALSV